MHALLPCSALAQRCRPSRPRCEDFSATDQAAPGIGRPAAGSCCAKRRHGPPAGRDGPRCAGAFKSPSLRPHRPFASRSSRSTHQQSIRSPRQGWGWGEWAVLLLALPSAPGCTFQPACGRTARAQSTQQCRSQEPMQGALPARRRWPLPARRRLLCPAPGLICAQEGASARCRAGCSIIAACRHSGGGKLAAAAAAHAPPCMPLAVSQSNPAALVHPPPSPCRCLKEICTSQGGIWMAEGCL